MSDTPRTRARPQYHYLYGSTDVRSSGGVTSPSTVASTVGSPGTEHESLLGEGLVLTDNEEETPNTSEQDLQQLVVTLANGERKPSLPPPPAYDTDTSALLPGPSPPPLPLTIKPWYSRCCDSVLNVTGDHPIGHVTRMVLIMAVAICMCTLVMVLSPDSKNDAMGGTASGYKSGPRFDYIPFPIVDREKLGDPARGIVNRDLFDPVLLFKGTTASSTTNRTVDPFLKVPFPTGAFWTNFVVQPTSDRGFSYPVMVYPYAYKWSDTLLQASYPPLRRRVDEISIRDTFNPDITFGTAESVVKRHIMAFDSLSVTPRFFTSSGGFWETYMVQGSPYVTIKYQAATPKIKALSIFSDVGCPFDSNGHYKDGDTTIGNRSLKWGVCTPYDPLSTGGDDQGLSVLHGVQFLLHTNEGLTWILFASEPIALTFDTIRKTTVTAADKFSGVLRLALIPPSPGDGSDPSDWSVPLSNSSGLRRLIYHSPVYPTSGGVSWAFRTGTSEPSSLVNVKKALALSSLTTTKSFNTESGPSNKVSTIQFRFETKLMNDNTSSGSSTTVSVHDDLLMMSLPHHANSLRRDTMLSSKTFDLVYLCIKGAMSPVVGDTWSYDIGLPSIGFDDADITSYAQDLKSSVRESILENVQLDLNRVMPTLDENIYGFGKQVARLAQLTHIASVMDYSAWIRKGRSTDNTTSTGGLFRSPNSTVKGQEDAPATSHTFDSALEKLHSFLVDFLEGEVVDGLVFDAKFGGIVTPNGLEDSNADFGNGRYNDHHFHYGYILYACAILGRLNSTFVSEFGDHVDTLMFDIAHNGNGNSKTLGSVFFPLARHKNWYDGHSFASGLFPFGNGKSQESSSEAVNAYYGAYLWSLVREGAQDDPLFELTDFARLLLATEIRGAKTYWHLIPPEDAKNLTVSRPTVYNPSFLKNYMVGNLGMMDVICSTWFGTQSLYVHMINFLPVTAATSILFNQSYVEREFAAVIGPLLPNVEMAWRGYVISDHAIVDPISAWKEAQKLVSYELDAALSKSQVLYWISTRRGFNATKASIDQSNSTNSTSRPADTSRPNSQSTLCEDNRDCRQAGLKGFCCPTPKGIFLSCCSKKKD